MSHFAVAHFQTFGIVGVENEEKQREELGVVGCLLPLAQEHTEQKQTNN